MTLNKISKYRLDQNQSLPYVADREFSYEEKSLSMDLKQGKFTRKTKSLRASSKSGESSHRKPKKEKGKFTNNKKWALLLMSLTLLVALIHLIVTVIKGHASSCTGVGFP